MSRDGEILPVALAAAPQWHPVAPSGTLWHRSGTLWQKGAWFVVTTGKLHSGEICNLWCNYYDIQDSWDSVLDIIDWFFENQDVLIPAAGPGRWNDHDMDKSGIEVFWRPLSSNTSALVFFSRRNDMPYRYQSSLSKLTYTTGSYKIFDVFTERLTLWCQ